MSSAQPRRRGLFHTSALAGALAVSLAATAAFAQDRAYDIPAQPLSESLRDYGFASGEQIIFVETLVRGRQAPALQGEYSSAEALNRLLAGTGLTAERTAAGGLMIVQAGEGGSSPQGAGAGGDVDALIVTAQKREENIQDVPIAISAFSQKSLDEQKIEGGFDLVKAIPNVSFSKNNFTSYNFSIRGVGTKAVSATTDPGVAVAFNNTTLIQNRLFEQEYFDLERVEVLRGPQGTLYGRNATSGVINVISAKPDLDAFDGWLKGEIGNYDTQRLSAMVNVPIIEDVLAVRLAGALTDRQGYDFNSITRNAVNGRDLWSARLSVGFQPTDAIHADFIWERFNEDDDRLRTGKQLCHRDAGKLVVGETPTTSSADSAVNQLVRPALFSQGCKAGSLYDDAAFGTPNGVALPFILGAFILGNEPNFGIGYTPADGHGVPVLRLGDPYGGMTQSRDLREMASLRDPRYRAKSDLLELNVDIDLSDTLTFYSQTAYVQDEVYSFQDFNRFNTLPVFTNTSTVQPLPGSTANWRNLAPNGVFCDPQIGCSNTMAGFDISQATAEQFSQEFRLQSSYDGPFNFSFGANYTKFDVLVDYYVMYNVISALAQTKPFNQPIGDDLDIAVCAFGGYMSIFGGVNPRPSDDPAAPCPYIDPNPVESINGEGHNYFRSKNPYELESWAGFGEVYYEMADDLKFTFGLRYTNDEKSFIPVPSQILLAPSYSAGGTISKGYPERPAIEQQWGEWTGRIGVDWQPDLGFTDETMAYAFYSRGYKGGGANPPAPGYTRVEDIPGMIERGVFTAEEAAMYQSFGAVPTLTLTAVEYGPTFDAEFVDAFEVGIKNTLLGGALMLNVTGFYYDYKDYQVSQIRDRTAVNENFDATSWGLELETLFAPSRDLRINFNLGYLDTEIADGETSIDIMNRTQGDPDFTLMKPWMQLPSNCVVPTAVAEDWLDNDGGAFGYWMLCGGYSGLPVNTENLPHDPNFDDELYDVDNYPELNGGAGIRAQLGGNELPNAPHWTANLGAQYGIDILDGWRATVRGDVYWQSQSWHRVYNSDPYDKLHGWYNANLSLWFERPDDGLKIELYVKNLLDDTPITDAFLNSDDTGLTTNVFTLDPRLIGLSIRKEF